jgi:hypothetical protein
MAPVPHVLTFLFSRSQQEDQSSISDLAVSSLELDSRSSKDAAWTPSSNDIFVSHLRPDDVSARALSPMAVNDLGKRTVDIHARDDLTNNYRPGAGSQSPDKFSGPGFLVLFALLGTGMVVASIWFFFWAKNGGFVPIQNEDWEDYKSTVMRRKGPDGKTLSNATKSTRLGGGSVVHGQDYMREKSIAATVIGRDEKGRKGIRAKRGFAKTHSVWGDDDYMTESWGTATVSDGMTEVRTEYTGAGGNDHSKRYRDRDIHQYKREKPARVGGLNRVADGSHYDHTSSERSDTYTDTSSNTHRKERSTKDHARSAHDDAERRAKIEAHKMERRWKKEAEDAAAAMARENGEAPPPPKRSSAPSSKPAAHKQRRNSRSSSPKKRDFSYQSGPTTELLSTAYTASNSDRTERTASYYDSYRPKNVASDGYGSDAGSRRPRQSSPKKGGRSHGGYRRGADSDLD